MGMKADVLPTRSPSQRLTALAVLALISVACFMLLDARSDWSFILEHRGPRLAAMLLVAYAVGVSTVLFQTIAHNRILTPGLMGFDALAALVQSVTVVLWSADGLNVLPASLRFALEVLIIVLLALLFFRLLFSGAVRSLHLMIMLGLLFGLLFRELADLAMRVLDPTEFMIRQGPGTASFNRVDTSLLGVAAGLIALGSLWALPLRRSLDVLLLGRDVAINLGVDHERVVMRLLAVIAVLVAAATALVGPTVFFGLLIANAAYWLTGAHQHRWTLPASVLAGVVCLVGGEVLLQHGFASSLPLAMIIEFLGGLLFIALLMRGVGR